MGPREGSTPVFQGVQEETPLARFISFFDSWEADFHFPKVHAELVWGFQPGRPLAGAVDKTLRFGTKCSEAQNTANSYRPEGIVATHFQKCGRMLEPMVGRGLSEGSMSHRASVCTHVCISAALHKLTSVCSVWSILC